MVAFVTSLHNLFTAAWIGGLLTLTLSVLPAVKSTLGKGPQTGALMQAVQDRSSRVVYISIIGLIITGLLLSKQNGSLASLFGVSSDYALVLTLKHVLVIAMIIVTLSRSQGLKKWKLAASTRDKLRVRLLFANLALGIGVLVLSGFSVVLAR